MPSSELLPVLAGAVLGAIVAAVRNRRWTLFMAILLGVLATIASGEHNASWAYVLLDVALVAVSALVTYAVLRWARRRSLIG